MMDRSGRPPATQASTPGSAVGFVLLLLFLFATYSRIFDFFVPPFRLIAVLAIAVALVALITGGLFRAIKHPVTVCLLAFTAWAALTIPFSVWPGGSLDALLAWLRSLLVFGLITAFTTTYPRLLAVVKTVAAAVLVLTGFTYAIGTTVLGRLSLHGTKFGNPNDLAGILLMTLPLWWFLAFRPGVALPWRVLSLPCILLLLGAFAKTGSRAGLAALAAVLLAAFFLGSSRRRIPMILGTLVIVGIAFAFVPRIVFERYTTLFQGTDPAETADNDGSSEAEARAENAATSSAESRWLSFKESLAVTARHPLLGVGLGQFMVEQNELAQDRGQRGTWRLTHNTYTQISSETGIPGLILYLGAMLGCWRALRKVFPRRRVPTGQPEASLLAENLALMLVAFAVSALFSSVGYDSQFPVLAGMAVALSRLDLTSPATSAQQPGPVQGGAAGIAPARSWRTSASAPRASSRYPGA